MATHARVNGKGVPSRREERLKSENARLSADFFTLNGALARANEENVALKAQIEALATTARARAKADEQKTLENVDRRSKALARLEAAAARQKREWAETVKKGARAVIEGAAACGDNVVGFAAIQLEDAADALLQWCDAELLAHRVKA